MQCFNNRKLGSLEEEEEEDGPSVKEKQRVCLKNCLAAAGRYGAVGRLAAFSLPCRACLLPELIQHTENNRTGWTTHKSLLLY